MNKELARTLTVALVSYLDENRPKGTMDCSSGECVSLENAFTKENFDSVETLINKKLSRLTEFETHLKWLIENGGSGIEHVKVGAKELLAIAKKELLKDDILTKKHLEGYSKGREDTMREMNDFLKSHFNSEEAKGPNPPAINIPTWTPPCYNGGPCTNPQMDCINCPMKTTGGEFSTSSGTSTATLHGNTSATDGKEHNPSFTD